MTEDELRIRAAFVEAERFRPFGLCGVLIDASMPAGGDWKVTATHGAVTRSVWWRSNVEVALVNPRGDLDDQREGEIAMALRAAPVMDSALRSIIALARSSTNLELIERLATAVIAFVEQPAPPFPLT